jgi:hypothetical protein
METCRNAANCRWAVSTLSLNQPLWLEAWNSPWSCVRQVQTRALHTTDECGVCPHWQPRHERTSVAAPPAAEADRT